MSETGSDKPIIEYPTTWEYKVIGEDPQRVAAAVASVIGDEPYEISPSHRSATGKYHSFNVEMIVRDESHRTSVFESIAAHPDVIMVL